LSCTRRSASVKRIFRSKKLFFFNWPTLNLNDYIIKLLKFSLIILFFSIPITNYYYYYLEFFSDFILLNFFIVIYSEIFLLLRIYWGWSYVANRLNNPIVEYEESGWYDGQLWVKPIKILKQDRLIFYYKVVPILNRLKKSIVYFSLISIIFFLFTIIICQ
jgi:hypothetical protein